MKFYGNGIVWDKEKNKRLCKFVEGEFETDDNRIVNNLVDLGYKYEGVLIDVTTHEDSKPMFIQGIEEKEDDGVQEEIQEEIQEDVQEEIQAPPVPKKVKK